MDTTEVNVRGKELKLMTTNRSLQLCARMNYETENLDFIDNIKSGSIFFDLGACEGRFSVYSGLKNIKTYSFEPEFDNHKVLNDNIRINDLSGQITAFNLALGDLTKQGSMLIGQPWPGGHQKIVDHDQIREDVSKFNFQNSQQIQIVDLDTFLTKKLADFPNYIKIDIDGSEMPFINGARSTLKDERVKELLFELDESDKNFNEILSQLDDFGFRIFEKYSIPDEPTLFNYWFKRK